MKDGDQHREYAATNNPFISEPINGYTAHEIATLQARLERQLGPEYISHRSNGASGKVSYLEAFKVINLANEVFGFNGWSSEVRNIHIDFVDEKADHRYSIGLSVTARVTLRDGTFHEDVGYGSIENCRGKAAAFEKCKKEGTTDAMKRALRNFGNVLGNCLYDKIFLANISKVKVPSAKFDPEMLHRRPEFSLPADHPKMQAINPNKMAAPEMARRSSTAGDRSAGMRQESLRSEPESYGDDVWEVAEFSEDRPGNYDEMTLDESMLDDSPNQSSVSLTGVQAKDTTTAPAMTYMPPNEFINSRASKAPEEQTSTRQNTITQIEAKRLHAVRHLEKDKIAPSVVVEGYQPQSRPPPPPFVPEPAHPAIDGAVEPPANYQPSFMTSRSLVQPTAAPALFDPKVSSPSIPKSGLADLSRSTPIKRPGASTATAESPSGTGSPLRRMGSSIAGAAPGFNRSGPTQFRAPSKLSSITTRSHDSQKRGSEVLAEHPAGSISLNGRAVSDGSGTEKKMKS